MNAVEKTTRSIHDGFVDPNKTAGHRTAPSTKREEWIQKYTGRILRAWFHQPTALGLAWTYANWIRKDLANIYSQPLKKAFIEKTY